MKYFTKRLMGWVVQCLVMMLMALLFAPLIEREAKAQVQPTTFGSLTQVPGTVAASTTVSTNSGAIPVRKDRGITFLPFVTGDNVSVANTVWTFQVSADGTNYTTTGPLSYTMALNSTNAVVGYKAFTPAELNNVRYIRLGAIQNVATNSITITRVQYSYFN